MLTQLSSGKIHVALMARPGPKFLRGLEFRELGRHPIFAMVAPKHPLAKAKSVSLARLIQEPLIAFSRRGYPEYLSSIEKLFSGVKGRLQVAEEHDDISSVMTAVETGNGFAFVTGALAPTLGKRLKLVALVPALPPVIVGIAYSQSSHTTAAKHFVEATASRE
jgi:DNA-binding transcriptional LysR family regulator